MASSGYAAVRTGTLDNLEFLPVSHDPDIKKRVLFAKGIIPHVTQFSQAVFLPGQVAHAHSHKDMYELFLFTEGSGVFTIDGQEFPIRAGSFFLCEPGETHTIGNSGNTNLVVTMIGIEDRIPPT